MADNIQGGGGNPSSSSTSQVRDYRKGNWTVSETMILIEAKKMDDERRMKRNDNNNISSEVRMNKPAELRWKWVEDYCWRKGCLRSQNQCNDKWDNLMRDYKKVRDYERKLQQTHLDHDQDGDKFSYWKMEKNERKDKNLPTNMLPQIYEALVEVVEKRVLVSGSSSVSTPTHPRLLDRTPIGTSTTTTISVVNVQQQHYHQQPPPPPPLLLPRQHISSMPSPIITALPLPPPVTVTEAATPTPIQQVHPVILPYSHPILPTMCDSSDSDTSEHSDSPSKRRRKSTDQHHHHQEQQGTTSASPIRNVNTAATLSSSPTSHEVASAISRSASVIAEALLANIEREDRRHRDLLSLHERRLKIEESKTEVNKQGINGLVDAINKLANSIQALASEKHHSSPSSSKPS